MSARSVEARRRTPAWRLAARLARREVRRRPGRTLLAVVLVAVPVAGMVTGVVLARTGATTRELSWSQLNGTADAASGSTLIRAGDLPGGSRLVEYRSVERAVRTVDGRGARALITDLPVTDPITAGMVRVVEGRPPSTAGEVLLAPALASDLGVTIGGIVDLDEPARLTGTVAGLGYATGSVRDPLLVVGPGRRNDIETGRGMHRQRQLIDLPDDISPGELAARAGELGLSRSPLLAPGETGRPNTPDDATTDVLAGWVIGTLVLVVAGIVIAAAFATSARRQLTTLGQLAANGASPAVLRRVLVLQGMWTGGAGAVVGLMVGAAILLTGRSRLDLVFTSERPAYRWSPLDLVPVVAAALVVSTVAAAVPARSAVRIPVLTALAGRRPAGRVPRSLTVIGGVTFAAGVGLLALGFFGQRGSNGQQPVVWTFVVAAATVAVLLGMCASTPALAGALDPLAGRLPGTWRLAARSLGRRRTHTTAMVAAICACAGLTLAASAVVVGNRYEAGGLSENTPADQAWLTAHRTGIGPDVAVAVPGDTVESVRDGLAEAEVIQLTAAEPAPPGSVVGQQIDWPNAQVEHLTTIGRRATVVADDAALSVHELSDHARRQLDEEGALAVGLRRGRVTAGLFEQNTSPSVKEGLPRQPELQQPFAVAVVTRDDAPDLNGLLVTPRRARDLGFVTVPGPVVLRTHAPLTDGQRALLDDLPPFPGGAPGPDQPVTTSVNVTTRGPELPVRRSVLAEAGLGLASLVVTLFVVAAGLALAAVETRDERDLITVAGADPRTIRRVSGRKALILVLAGTALAVPVGLVPTAVSLAAGGALDSFAFPWRTVLALVAVVPAVAALAVQAASAAAQRLRPVRVSMMAFD